MYAVYDKRAVDGGYRYQFLRSRPSLRVQPGLHPLAAARDAERGRGRTVRVAAGSRRGVQSAGGWHA